MSDENGYKTPQSAVHRLKNRGRYDFATVHSLIDACPVLHVSFNAPSADEPYPVILPMLGATGNFASPDADPAAGPRSIYLHGHAASRLMKLPDTAAAAANGGEEAGVPTCVAATFVDGLVLTYTAFHNSCNYRSAVAFGRAVAVHDEAERTYAMALITDNMLPGRWDDGRPPNKAELTSTGILRVDIAGASAKLREGSTSEDRHDLRDEELRARTWVGVVPMHAAWGTPVPSADNKVAKVSDYITQYTAAQNKEGEKYSIEVIQKGKK